jgi:hypothetical protein
MSSDYQTEFILDERYPLCSKCGENHVYAAGGPHMDWCEPCLWKHIETDQRCNEPLCELKPKRKRRKRRKK